MEEINFVKTPHSIVIGKVQQSVNVELTHFQDPALSLNILQIQFVQIKTMSLKT